MALDGGSKDIQLVGFTRWAVEALLVPVFRRAAATGSSMIYTDDLLLEVRRKSQLGAACLADLEDGHKTNPLEGTTEVPLAGRPQDRTIYRYEAEAMLREIANDQMAASKLPTRPVWSDLVARSLEVALQSAAVKGLTAVGEIEIISGLISDEESRASRLMTISGIDRVEIASQMETNEPSKRSIWTPAVDLLEMQGVLPTPRIVRLLTWLFRLAQRRLGPRFATLTVLEEEATRQAARTGSIEVRLEHIVIATISVWHQLALNKVEHPEQIWPAGWVLECGGISYPSVVQLIASGTLPALSMPDDSRTNQVRTLRKSQEADAFLETARTWQNEDETYVVEALLSGTRGKGSEIIAALGGDVDRVRQAISIS